MSRVIAAFSQFFDSAGDPLANGWLEFLYSGTTSTEKNTYSDSAQTIENANPLQLDGDGRCPNVFGSGVYKVKLYTNNPVTGLPGDVVQTFDPVQAQATITGTDGQFAEWNSATTYDVADIVTCQGCYYKSIAASNINYPPQSTPTKWAEFDFLNYWNTNVTYAIDVPVFYGASIYISLQAANIGNQPDTSPTYWSALGSGTTLLQWEENGTTFRPKSSGGDIGDATHLVGDAYFQDAAKIYMGNSQDGYLTFGGTDVALVAANGTSAINFQTGATPTTKWQVSNAGMLLPGAANSYDLGSTTNELRAAYFAGSVYFGSGQEARIYHNATDFIFLTTTGKFSFSSAGSTVWEIDASGYLVPGAANTYDIGTAALEIRSLYMGNSGTFWLGSAQAGLIKHDGSNMYIGAKVGALYFQSGTTPTSRWIINSSGHLYPAAANTYDLGTTSAELRNIYATGSIYLGATQQGRIRHNATDMIIDAVSGKISLAVGGTTAWNVNTSGHLIPQLANTYDIGAATNEVKTAYIGTAAYFGLSQGGQILHSTNFTINAVSGSLYLQTASTLRWYIGASSGHLIPYPADTYDIGGASSEVRSIYIGDNGRAYFGLGSDLSIYSNGTHGYIVGAASAGIYIGTDATTRWVFWTDGSFQPNVANSYNIGSTSKEIKHIYHGDAGYAYYGSDQDGYVRHDGSNFYVSSETGALLLRNNSGGLISFQTNGGTLTTKWNINSSGHLYPHANNSYDLGTTSNSIKNIYAYGLYLGASSEGIFTHDGTDLEIANSDASGVIDFGVGNPVPASTLTISAASVYSASNVNLGSAIVPFGNVWFTNLTASGVITMVGVYSNSVTGRDVYIDSGGDVGYLSSARRFKENIVDIWDTSWIHRLQPRQFNRIGDSETEVGFIAEEVADANQDFVFCGKDGRIDGVDYRQINVALLAEVQKLRMELDELKGA